MDDEEDIAGTEATAPEETEGSEKRRRLSDAEYATIRDRYELGTHGITELADEYGVSRQALSKRFKDDGVTRGSRAHELAAATTKGATSAAAAVGAASVRYADKREDWIEETRVQGYNALKQADLLARKTVADAVRASHTMASVDDNLKAIHRYQKILAENVAARLRLLNAEDSVAEDGLPSLDIEDLTDADVLKHHKTIGAVPEDATSIEDFIDDEIDGLDLEDPVP